VEGISVTLFEGSNPELSTYTCGKTSINFNKNNWSVLRIEARNPWKGPPALSGEKEYESLPTVSFSLPESFPCCDIAHFSI
jgi:hypothetical protein